jgi:heme-degrading monooxygenase HmoA
MQGDGRASGEPELASGGFVPVAPAGGAPASARSPPRYLENTLDSADVPTGLRLWEDAEGWISGAQQGHHLADKGVKVYARSTTIVANPSSIDQAVALVRDEVMPALMRIEGCLGLSCLIERSSGRCIATSAWQSLETMKASESQVAPVRGQLITSLGASRPLVQEWEIPVMHRAQPAPTGAYARLTWLQGEPANVDSSIESFKTIIPVLDDLPGFCSASLLIDRSTGQAVSTVVYESSEAVAQTRDAGQTLRSRVAEQTGAEIIDVAEFELALAHLRVPELV